MNELQGRLAGYVKSSGNRQNHLQSEVYEEGDLELVYIRIIETKSILSKLREKDTYFGISYNMNLYRGCQHACIYCDTRSECYGINDMFQEQCAKSGISIRMKFYQPKIYQQQSIFI